MNFSEKLKDDSNSFLIDTLKINTVNPDGNELDLAKYINEWAIKQGMCSEILHIEGNRANIRVSIKGLVNKNSLLLNGHLDTVPPGDLKKWKRNPFEPYFEEGRIFGRGTSDMKGGLCAMLYAMKLIVNEGIIPHKNIVFIGTFDEESLGRGAEKMANCLLEGKFSDLIISEPTGNKISIASKGALWLKIISQGKTAHGAYAETGINAIEGLYEFKKKLDKLLFDEEDEYQGYNTCNMTMIKGGIKTNVIPDYAEATIDIRTSPKQNQEHLIEKVQQLEHLWNKDVDKAYIEIEIMNRRECISIDQKSKLVGILQEAHEAVLGLTPELTVTKFFSDASIFSEFVKISTVLYGPGESEQAHISDESISIKNYHDSIKVYYQLIKSYRGLEESE